jgi:hypothetical protein
MGLYRIFILFLLGFSKLAMATTIVPTSLSTQLKDADAVVEAVFLSETSRVLPSGEIATVASFRLLKAAGLSQAEIYNVDNFKAHYPGGTHLGRVVQVQSAPSFRENEHVLLLLEKRNFGYLIQNLSLGKYEVTRQTGGEVYLRSSLFPYHHELGRIPLESALTAIKNRFHGSELQEVKGASLVTQPTESHLQPAPSRRPASVSSPIDSPSADNRSSLIWTFIFFVSIALLAGFCGRRSVGKSEQ